MSRVTQALIMAAGHATRMRPLTDNLPKPLLEVDGLPLLTHIINHLDAEGVTTIIINGYHAIAPLKKYMDAVQTDYPHINFILSEETELLETGGGAVLARQYLNPAKPFYMINGDAYWINGTQGRSLDLLVQVFNSETQDILLLLQPCASMAMTEPVGDYHLENGFSSRAKDKNGDHMFTGVRVCMPSVLGGYAIEKFSFLEMMDKAEQDERLGGLSHEGEWYHISTPKDLDDVNMVMRKRQRA